MKAGELIEHLRAFDPDSEVLLFQGSGTFARPVWVGIMDTSYYFDDVPDFQLVISPWEPESYLRPFGARQE